MGDHSTLNSSDVNNANIDTSNSGRLPGSFSLSEPRHCGCKGIRTCRLCGYSKSKQNIIQTPLYGLDCQDNKEKPIGSMHSHVKMVLARALNIRGRIRPGRCFSFARLCIHYGRNGARILKVGVMWEMFVKTLNTIVNFLS
ncbi:unnamed protein product [Lymnaea stagnalis]|uniref:Uncharacterized protein n=1 Tax=Lymnaea stagnalis TaxID=6523 RepID=A0AAV2HQL2_LYMST